MAKAAKQSLIVTVSKDHNINNVARDLKGRRALRSRRSLTLSAL
jgi:hypothetical protein